MSLYDLGFLKLHKDIECKGKYNHSCIRANIQRYTILSQIKSLRLKTSYM